VLSTVAVTKKDTDDEEYEKPAVKETKAQSNGMVRLFNSRLAPSPFE